MSALVTRDAAFAVEDVDRARSFVVDGDARSDRQVDAEQAAA